jgi:phosphohistidine phosphatase
MANNKALYIVRHGKSSWDYDNISDIDRPLIERGIRNCYEMANRLKMLDIEPGLMISSPANRAIHTALIFSRVLEYPTDQLIINEKIYHSVVYDNIDIIKNTDKEIQSLFIFGHNPTFTDLANHFVKNKIDNIPTTGIVTLKFTCDSWKKIMSKTVEFENFDYPKKK